MCFLEIGNNNNNNITSIKLNRLQLKNYHNSLSVSKTSSVKIIFFHSPPKIKMPRIANKCINNTCKK